VQWKGLNVKGFLGAVQLIGLSTAGRRFT